MGWGALSGLGAGMTQLGGELMDMNKRKVAEKLAQDRELRADERQIAKEDRALQAEKKRVAGQRLNEKSGLVEYLNSDYEVLRSEQATQEQLDSAKLAREKDSASVAKLLADADLATKRAAGEETKQSLANRLAEAKIATESSRAGSYNRANRDTGGGASGSGNSPVTRESAIEDLVQSVKGQLSGANMSEAEAYQYAETALAQAEAQRKSGRNIDPKRLLSTIIFNNARPDDDEDED